MSSQQPTTSSGTSNGRPIPKDRRQLLKEKIQAMRSQRTGVERRKQLAEYKKNHVEKNETSNELLDDNDDDNKGKKKNKSIKSAKQVMKSVARDGLRQILDKFNVHDPHVENLIMSEVLAGHIKTPQQMAQCITQKLQLLKPNQAPRPSRPTSSTTTTPTTATTTTPTTSTPTPPAAVLTPPTTTIPTPSTSTPPTAVLTPPTFTPTPPTAVLTPSTSTPIPSTPTPSTTTHTVPRVLKRPTIPPENKEK